MEDTVWIFCVVNLTVRGFFTLITPGGKKINGVNWYIVSGNGVKEEVRHGLAKQVS